MAKKARQRISYVLELPNASPGGHRLGVNGLAVDWTNSILYTGGRDGVVCAWDLNIDLGHRPNGHAIDTSPKPPSPVPTNGTAKSEYQTQFRAQTHAHTHWINDIALVQNRQAVVSASSDLLVKVWRPHAEHGEEAATIGQHADYVKCVAAPSQEMSWVATGGLDRKIILWDLGGGGRTLEINVSGEEVVEKGSVYALGVNRSMLASGGPESIVRLWDPRSGQRITKFVGHTDNIRAILVNEAGDMVLTGSSDQTVKVWSVTAGRCMHTLTMHNDSVWSLFSEEPSLGLFYSSDRSGLVVRTDVRDTNGEMDDGLSIAIAQENEGVSKVVACRGHIWTATSRSSIHRWADVDTGPDMQLPELYRQHRAATASAKGRQVPMDSRPAYAAVSSPAQVPTINGARKEIPAKAFLRISNTASFPPSVHRDVEDATSAATRKGPEVVTEPFLSVIEPVHHLPEETLEGQFGLVKHRLLNDRRRVLTLDTAGDVLLWDLIECEPIQSFGKRHLEDVEPAVNTLEAVAPWCSIDTSSGHLTIVLEPFNCFDAEIYADELTLDEDFGIREDQRINLGKWVLRYLFAELIDEEVRRDEVYRRKLNETMENRRAATRVTRSTSMAIPEQAVWEDKGGAGGLTSKLNGFRFPPITPGQAIRMVTHTTGNPAVADGAATLTNPADTRPLAQFPRRPMLSLATDVAHEDKTGKQPAAEAEKDRDREKEKDKDAIKAPGTPFSKKFRMPFGVRKLSRSASTAAMEKLAAVADEKTEGSEASSTNEREVDESFSGLVKKLRNEYDKQVADRPNEIVQSRLTPSPSSDTPTLKLPRGTKVILQEETSGGSVELYRGTVATVGADADLIEPRAPMWLGEVLLLNAIPQKEPAKVSFVLHPYHDLLPPIPTADGSSRLNANRMLRVKKVIAYVAERIDPMAIPDIEAPDVQRPEDCLELYCNDQLLPITMSLATLRAHVWKGGTDVVLHYKAKRGGETPFRPTPAVTSTKTTTVVDSEVSMSV